MNTRQALDGSVTRIHSERIRIDQILETAQHWGVTVQDLLFAATLEALVREKASYQRGWLRTQIALLCPVDLRRTLQPTARELFGQFLGTYQVRHTIESGATFREVASNVHKDTSSQKQQNAAAYYLPGMSLISFFHRHMPGESGFVTGRSLFPIMGGISNSNLKDQFQEEFTSGTVIRYTRATHLGHVLPMMLFATSFGEHMTFASTRRESFLDDEAMQRVVSHVAHRIGGDEGPL